MAQFQQTTRGSSVGASTKQKPSYLPHRVLLTFVLLLGTLSSSVYAADQGPNEGGSASKSATPVVAGIAGATGLLAMLAVGLLVHRRRRHHRAPRRTSSLPSPPHSGLRTPRTRLPSDALFRHAVTNQSHGASFKTSSNGRSRRKAAPSAIMVEVPPPSHSPTISPATQSIGLHVPPSPAYDFRGRSNIDMPVTPRTPCMNAPSPSHGDADRMV